MKLLLDECLPVDFRHSFPRHEAHTAEWAGLKGKKKCELLTLAEAAGYDVLLTVDQGIFHQQRLTGRQLSVLRIRSRTNEIEELLPFVEALNLALRTIQPGQSITVPEL